jgi:hypothetical protein
MRTVRFSPRNKKGESHKFTLILLQDLIENTLDNITIYEKKLDLSSSEPNSL